jgi:hypothetical protein
MAAKSVWIGHQIRVPAAVSVFNGSAEHFNSNAGIGLTSLVGAAVLVTNFTSSFFDKCFWPLNAVGVLGPGANLRSSHNTKPTSIRRSDIAREAAA